MRRRSRAPLPFKGQKDANGRRRCGHCGLPVGLGRRNWCSDGCVQRWKIRSGDQNAARQWLWARQLGVCQLCSTNTLRPEDRDELAKYGGGPERHPDVWPLRHWPRGDWEADHAVPLAEGGSREPENLRTLCKPCHRRETAALRKRLAEARRAQETA